MSRRPLKLTLDDLSKSYWSQWQKVAPVDFTYLLQTKTTAASYIFGSENTDAVKFIEKWVHATGPSDVAALVTYLPAWCSFYSPTTIGNTPLPVIAGGTVTTRSLAEAYDEAHPSSADPIATGSNNDPLSWILGLSAEAIGMMDPNQLSSLTADAMGLQQDPTQKVLTDRQLAAVVVIAPVEVLQRIPPDRLIKIDGDALSARFADFSPRQRMVLYHFVVGAPHSADSTVPPALDEEAPAVPLSPDEVAAAVVLMNGAGDKWWDGTDRGALTESDLLNTPWAQRNRISADSFSGLVRGFAKTGHGQLTAFIGGDSLEARAYIQGWAAAPTTTAADAQLVLNACTWTAAFIPTTKAGTLATTPSAPSFLRAGSSSGATMNLASMNVFAILLLQPEQLDFVQVSDLTPLNTEQLRAVFSTAKQPIVQQFSGTQLQEIGETQMKARFHYLTPSQKVAVFNWKPYYTPQPRKWIWYRREYENKYSYPILPLTASELASELHKSPISLTLSDLKATLWDRWLLVAPEDFSRVIAKFGLDPKFKAVIGDKNDDNSRIIWNWAHTQPAEVVLRLARYLPDWCAVVVVNGAVRSAYAPSS
jgi:hypothetical protein